MNWIDYSRDNPEMEVQKRMHSNYERIFRRLSIEERESSRQYGELLKQADQRKYRGTLNWLMTNYGRVPVTSDFERHNLSMSLDLIEEIIDHYGKTYCLLEVITDDVLRIHTSDPNIERSLEPAELRKTLKITEMMVNTIIGRINKANEHTL